MSRNISKLMSLLFKRYFTLNTRKRREAKEALWRYLVDYRKWGITYSVFDDVELLEASLRSVRASADYINVVYQNESWYGTPANESMLPELERLKSIGLIDELILYKVDLSKTPRWNQLCKRNVGLKSVVKEGCYYCMTMDGDEFYIDSEIENSKYLIVKNNITHSFCSIVNYGFSPEMRCLDYADFSCAFFLKCNVFSKFIENKKNIARIDPTRGLNHKRCSKYYFLNSVCMHHMSLIRKDLKRKYDNSSHPSAKKHFKSLETKNMEKDYFKVDDIFDLMKIVKEWK